MKKVFLQVFFLSSFLLLLSCQKVSAVDQLKVATFNTQRGTPTGSCDQEANPKREAKIRPLAQYIKDKQYDVILLQEMILFADSDCYYDEVIELSKQLTNIGYQMDYATIPESLRTDHMRVATFSRFPIQHNATTYIVDLPSEPARTFLVTPITTPLGKVNFYNAHVRHRDPQQCPGVNKLLQAMLADQTPLKLVGGDFNLMLSDENKCNGPLDSFNFLVKSRGQIDFLMTPKNSNIEFLNSYIDAGSPTSDHKAVVSFIGSTLAPTPTPSPSPMGCMLQGLKRIDAHNAPENSPIAAARLLIDGITIPSSSTQPFFVQITPGRHTVSIEQPQPEQYSLGYTACYNSVDCHTVTPEMKNEYVVNCTAGYIDLWWHFTTRPTPSPNPSASAQKTGDVDSDGDVDIFDYNLLLGNFSRTGTPGFSTVDIVKNGSIDIFDYNALLANFGK